MIGKLKGTVDEIGEDHVLVDVHGVCYLAFCSGRTLSKLNAGEAVTLFIETYVREDQLKLFGFASALEREWFRLLQSVQGVGSKVSLAILSTLTPSDLANAIALQDKTAISRAPGVGPLSGWRGKNGKSLGKGEPNPNQLKEYIKNGSFFVHHLPKHMRYFKHANRDYLDWANSVGFIADAEQLVFQLYMESMQKFQPW